MSFFSRSRSKGHYPKHSQGGEYYKRPHGSGSILGKIFEALTGSGRRSSSYSGHHRGHSGHRHHRKSSWS